MPRIYVGTYAKYNNGSIKGDWLDLEYYGSRDDFYQACAVLHKDEHDPELMFQDWEDIPDKFISESHLDEDIYPNWIDLDDDTRAHCEMAWDNVDTGYSVEEINDRYAGDFESEEDWAAQFWDDTGMINGIPEGARNYINFDAYARDCQLSGDVTFVHRYGRVHVFMNN